MNARVWRGKRSARSRIGIFEHGFLAQLETLLLEIDVEDYEAGRIDIDTWERDFNRYHTRGEQLIGIKTSISSRIEGRCIRRGVP